MSEVRDLSAPELLFLKLSTSGLYRRDLSIDDPSQPWCPEISAALCNRAGVIVQHFSLVVKSDGRTSKESATKVHGVTARASAQIGVPEPRALGLLGDMMKTAPMDRHLKVVSFGDMDRMVIASLFARFAVATGKPSSAYDRLWLRRPLIEFVDLQKPYAQQLCKLPSEFEDKTDFKWPSIDEAAEIILGRPQREGLRDAWSDLMILRDLYVVFEQKGFFAEGVAA